MHARKADITDLFFAVEPMPNPNVDARYEPVTRPLTTTPEFRMNTLYGKLTAFHEVDHAASWALRTFNTHKEPEAFAKQNLISEEAARFALSLEIMDAKLHGKLRIAASDPRGLQPDFRKELAQVLGLQQNSPNVNGVFEYAQAYFAGKGTLSFYPPAFLKHICAISASNTFKAGEIFLPYVEKHEGRGDTVAYDCSAN